MLIIAVILYQDKKYKEANQIFEKILNLDP